MRTKVIFIGLIILMTSCVQKAYKRTVVFKLDVKGIKNIKKVGIRGKDNPLNWDHDYEMKIDKDSVYTAIISGETGYLYTEFKFTINDEFELQEKDNRRVYFQNKDTTVYKAKFNRMN